VPHQRYLRGGLPRRRGEPKEALLSGANFSLTDVLSGFLRVSTSFLEGLIIMEISGAYVAAQPRLYRNGLIRLFLPRADQNNVIKDGLKSFSNLAGAFGNFNGRSRPSRCDDESLIRKPASDAGRQQRTPAPVLSCPGSHSPHRPYPARRARRHRCRPYVSPQR